MIVLLLQVLEGAVAVVLPQPALEIKTRNVNPGVFGGQMFPNDASAAAIGMRTVRSGPLWEWSQPNECWNESTCFDWSFYDGIFSSSGASEFNVHDICRPCIIPSNVAVLLCSGGNRGDDRRPGAAPALGSG